jgi:hypothetical protein
MIKSRILRWTGQVARLGENRNACRIVAGKPEGKIQLRRPRRRWEDNIGMDLREIGWSGIDWIDLSQDREQWRALVNTVMNLRVPQNVGKFLSSCATGGFSRWTQLHGVSYIIKSLQYCVATAFGTMLRLMLRVSQRFGKLCTCHLQG